MTRGPLKIEKDGWFIDVETLDVAQRPDWEIRCLIRRRKEARDELRRHRFYVTAELSRRLKLDALPEVRREDLLARAAKKVILREFQEIFAEPEGGLDSLRPLTEADFR